MDYVMTEAGCWEWQNAVNSQGYGSVWVDGTSRGAHVVSYESVYGPVPEGLELDHICENKICISPEHLDPVTHQENIARHFARNPKTHCKKGHEFTEENTIIRAGGKRRCRTCAQEYDRNWKKENRPSRAVKKRS